MQRIPVELAEEGMITAKPILRDNNVVLLGEGTMLTIPLIEKLKDLEIKKIAVQGHPVDTGEEEKSLEEKLTDLDERFKKSNDNKLALEIKSFIADDIKQRQEESDL